MTGAVRAFINLAYNIYLIAHHTEKNGDEIVKGYIDRLKSTRSDALAGALFETYAAAAFLKAGFTLEFENERDGSVSHVEFVALYPKTGNRFSVEVKARDHASGAAYDEVDDVKRLRVANKLNKGTARSHPERENVGIMQVRKKAAQDLENPGRKDDRDGGNRRHLARR
jgi:hypothetical protein